MIVALSPLDTNSVTFNGAHQKYLPSSSFTVLHTHIGSKDIVFIRFLQFSIFLHLFNYFPRFYFLHFIIQVFFSFYEIQLCAYEFGA